MEPNKGFADEMYLEFLHNPDSVSQEWIDYFIKNGYDISNFKINKTQKEPLTKQNVQNYIPKQGEILEKLNTIQTRIASNMEDSLEIPTATSTRIIPVKALDENRRIINKHLQKVKKTKVSFTHILSWAIVRALKELPHMNSSFIKIDDESYKIKKDYINIGFAVDVVRKGGNRLLLVPNIKNAEKLNFDEFILKLDELTYKARNNKIDPEDLQNTTVTLTNPGMIGTTSSNPRLMKGQGLIVATGAIDYPTEFQAVRPDILTEYAISKVVTITSTYDHRIIQGAESAEFLAYIHKLLIGEQQFYDQIFATLKIPFEPIKWELDKSDKDQRRYFGFRNDVIEKSAHVTMLINAYRVRGHLLASVNPLGFESYYYPELDPAYYGFTIWDLDRIFHADDSWKENNLPLRDIIEVLRDTYCGTIGIEFMHIQDLEKKEWIKYNLETKSFDKELSKKERITILKKLIEAEEFENFLHTKFVGHKRFSLEGSESVIVLIDKLLEFSADSGLFAVVIGMAHRGRLNVLVNNIGKKLETIFQEFEGITQPFSYHGSGDVKYHLGSKGNYVSPKNNTIPVLLAPNPSHLELVDPVIEGMARALDNQANDKTHKVTLPILIHGDSAFAGQGIVAETLNFSQLDGYSTGGTIHIIINNQIGFTTTSTESRSTIYATDIAKMIQVPIIHINGNDPEAIIKAAIFAFEYRQKFHTDVVLDVLSFRKYGHNESDEPSYTQPLLYKKIREMKQIVNIYSDFLISNKIISEDILINLVRDIQDKLYQAFNNRNKYKVEANITQKSYIEDIFDVHKTSVEKDTLIKITEAITTYPKNFNIHPKVKTLLNKRREMVYSEVPAIDWAMAEALAFGSILIEGKEIRMSGQDSRRGTFSQRHSVLTDIKTEDLFIPLNNISPNQAPLRIYDSPLSEIAILGFEYGYSTVANDSLTIWEAQFGDFANNAQSIFDQFISCAEYKWEQSSNITVLLPHSYDGQGPEHSSARIERYLQLCAENNMFVCNLTTPSQYFHVLRRQVCMKHRKPLIIFTPKSMLRHPKAVSSLLDFTDGYFHTILEQLQSIDKSNVKKLVLCSGKIFYDILEAWEKKKPNNYAIVTIEQLYPLDIELLNKIINNYENLDEVIWAQEEPQNMGAWSYISPFIQQLLNKNLVLSYIGRKASPATATGSFIIHQQEQNEIINQIFS